MKLGLVLLTLVLAFSLTATPLHARTLSDCGPAQPAPPTPQEQAVVDLTNAWRQSNNLPPLIYDPGLAHVAQWKATEDASLGSDDHNDPFRTWEQRFVDCGYAPGSEWLGENLAAGQHSAAEVVTDWELSPHHNENLLRPEFRYIGVAERSGVGPFGDYWVQEFAGSK